MILVVLTTFVCGGSFAKIIRVLEMEVTEQEVDPWATESPVTEGDGPVEDPDKTTQAYDMYVLFSYNLQLFAQYFINDHNFRIIIKCHCAHAIIPT